jgi:hypothetical protein
MHQGIGRLTLVALPLWLAACASWPQTLYHWGNYPDTIHAWYDGNDDWVGQEQALRKIISDAATRQKKVGPGVHGQLGLVLSRQGRDDEAKAEFAEEQALYPESATFMTRLQGRRTGNVSATRSDPGAGPDGAETRKNNEGRKSKGATSGTHDSDRKRDAASKPQDGHDMTSGKDNAAGGYAR